MGEGITKRKGIVLKQGVLMASIKTGELAIKEKFSFLPQVKFILKLT